MRAGAVLRPMGGGLPSFRPGLRTGGPSESSRFSACERITKRAARPLFPGKQRLRRLAKLALDSAGGPAPLDMQDCHYVDNNE